MESSSVCRSCSCSSTSLPAVRQLPVFRYDRRRRRRGHRYCVKVSASASRRSPDHGGGRGRLVDENLIVLRKRIHEMKMVERNYEPPEDWMEWEKQFYTRYDGFICDAMGMLQSQLMNTRPSLVLGVMALVALSIPTSTLVLFHNFLEIIKWVFAAAAAGTGIHPPN